MTVKTATTAGTTKTTKNENDEGNGICKDKKTIATTKTKMKMMTTTKTTAKMSTLTRTRTMIITTSMTTITIFTMLSVTVMMTRINISMIVIMMLMTMMETITRRVYFTRANNYQIGFKNLFLQWFYDYEKYFKLYILDYIIAVIKIQKENCKNYWRKVP